MSYQYKVAFELENEEARDSMSFMDPVFQAQILDAIEAYHRSKTVRNKKVLTPTFTAKVLYMDIESPCELDVPSKALAKFTRLLLEKSPQLSAKVQKRVFQSVYMGVPASSVDSISTADTFRAFVDVFLGDYSQKSVQKQEEQLGMQRKIKEILFRSNHEHAAP